MSEIKVIEVTGDNIGEYVKQIAELEKSVCEKMVSEGKAGWLFPTGAEDITTYAVSTENKVYVLLNQDGNVVSTVYITNKQPACTYNDLTKYFKTGKGYNEYVRSSYSSESEYRKAMAKAYVMKIEAFKKSMEKFMNEVYLPEDNARKLTFMEHLEKEIEDNGFHEKSKLRDIMNQFMSQYIYEK